MKNINIERRLIFDGSEIDIPVQIAINIGSDKITINKKEVYINTLSELKEKVSENQFETLSAGLIVKKIGNQTLYYIGKLMARYILTDKYIVILSFGEFQPDRYKIYLESAWEK